MREVVGDLEGNLVLLGLFTYLKATFTPPGVFTCLPAAIAQNTRKFLFEPKTDDLFRGSPRSG